MCSESKCRYIWDSVGWFAGAFEIGCKKKDSIHETTLRSHNFYCSIAAFLNKWVQRFFFSTFFMAIRDSNFAYIFSSSCGYTLNVWIWLFFFSWFHPWLLGESRFPWVVVLWIRGTSFMWNPTMHTSAVTLLRTWSGFKSQVGFRVEGWTIHVVAGNPHIPLDHFRVSKSLTFLAKLSATPFLLKGVLSARDSFKHQRFWATEVNQKWTFCIIGQWIGSKSRVNRLYKRKET